MGKEFTEKDMEDAFYAGHKYASWECLSLEDRYEPIKFDELIKKIKNIEFNKSLQKNSPEQQSDRV